MRQKLAVHAASTARAHFEDKVGKPAANCVLPIPITDDAAAAAPPVKKLRRFILGIDRDPIVLSIQRKQLRPHPFSPVNAD
jgi:hypothetical protein